MDSVTENDPARDLATIEPFWTLGITFLVVPAATLCLGWLALLFKLPSSAMPFWFALTLASLLLVFRLKRIGFKHFAILCLLVGFWIYLVLAVLISSWLLDNSWDGMTYHQEYAILLRNGWNPLFDAGNPRTSFVFADWWVWNHVYTKGAEIVASSLYWAFNQIEAAKAIHWLWYAASLLLSWCLFVSLAEKAPRRNFIAGVAAFIVATNPVLLCQLNSFYIDGDVVAALLCLFSSFGLIVMLPRLVSAWCITALVIVYLLNLKMYCLVYVAVTLVFGTLAIFRITKDRHLSARFFMLSSLAVAIGLIVGFNPYLIKCKPGQDCFYPYKMAYSMTARTQLLQQPPGLLVTKNSLGKLVLSIFSRTSSERNVKAISEPDNSRVKIMLPFFIDRDELANFCNTDTRLGGFGPWFGEILVAAFCISILSLIAQLRRNKDSLDSRQRIALWLALIVSFMTLANPICWWARYVPQLWLLPTLLLAACCHDGMNRRFYAVAAAVSLLYLINIGLVAVSNWRGSIQQTCLLRCQLNEARAACLSAKQAVSVFYPPTLVRCSSVPIRLTESGIPYRLVDAPAKPGDRVFSVTNLPIQIFLEEGSPSPPSTL